jgi:hypothetical protein
MMDVNGRDISKAKTAQEMEQDDGIATAGEPRPKGLIRPETGGEKSADPGQQISRQAVP